MENSKEKFRKKELGAEDKHIKTTKNIFGDFALSSSTASNRTIEISNHLIQCFVNPNFVVDENEYWKDN